MCIRDRAEAYLHPAREHLHDPMQMQDMDRAVACVREAIRRRLPIVVYGDYDVDLSLIHI